MTDFITISLSHPALGDSIFIQFISATAVFAADATVLVIMPKIVDALP